MARKGWQGAVLKMYRAKDYTFTVRSSTLISDYYQRLRVDDGGLLRDADLHPTIWARLWFEHPSGKPHQRAFTIVDPDGDAEEFALEVAIHDGIASRWALDAEPGETIDATLLATGPGGGVFALPEVAPSAYVLAGDTASLPAINSLLDAMGDVPAHVYLEWVHESDRSLPLRVRSGDHVTWIERARHGQDLVDAVTKASSEIGLPGDELYGWAACDTKSTRAIAKAFKETFGIPKSRVKAQGYWMP